MTVKLKGKAFWARVYEGNHDEYGGKEFYKITVALDDESWVKFNKSGSKLKPKEVSSDDDTLGITFRRDVHGKSGVNVKGKKWEISGGPPQVVDADGDEFDELIGNGSVVEVAVDFYKIKKGAMKGTTGHRLEGVKVLEHVQYDVPEDADEDDEDDTPEEPVKEEKKSESKKKLPF